MQAHWYRSPNALTWLLFPFSLLFRGAVALRRLLYRAQVLRVQRLSLPIIVVGNITVGGTGKTPLVIALARRLRGLGWNPGIVSRGHGTKNEAPREINPNDDALEAGDEPVLLAEKSGAPVWTGRDRPQTARALLRAHPECDVLISDDGLQHYALARNVEIVVIDGERRFGNGLLLPAGPLREPVSRLAAADALVINGGKALTGAGLPRQFSMRLNGDVFRNVAQPDRIARADDFRGKRLHAVAAIGNPQRFFAQLKSLGLEFVATEFPDHHAFSPADLRLDADAVLMTEKDAVKCRSFARGDWWALPVEAEVDDELLEFLNGALNGSKAARHSGLSAVQRPSHLQKD
ncbi:MAG: tetraacyldisaccharide 4'-kinase [Burkholderiales bacterium]